MEWLNIVLNAVCEAPPVAQAYAMTNPMDTTGQFFVGDTVDYECNGDLISNAPTTLTCAYNRMYSIPLNGCLTFHLHHCQFAVSKLFWNDYCTIEGVAKGPCLPNRNVFSDF